MEVISISTFLENETQTQEVRQYAPFREVDVFVSQAELAVYRMEFALDELAREFRAVFGIDPAKISKGLDALENADNAITALWSAREELSILRFLIDGVTGESIELFEKSFRIIRSSMRTVADYKAAVRNAMTSPGDSADSLAAARDKTEILKSELPGIMEAIGQIEKVR